MSNTDPSPLAQQAAQAFTALARSLSSFNCATLVAVLVQAGICHTPIRLSRRQIQHRSGGTLAPVQVGRLAHSLARSGGLTLRVQPKTWCEYALSPALKATLMQACAGQAARGTADADAFCRVAHALRNLDAALVLCALRDAHGRSRADAPVLAGNASLAAAIATTVGHLLDRNRIFRALLRLQAHSLIARQTTKGAPAKGTHVVLLHAAIDRLLRHPLPPAVYLQPGAFDDLLPAGALHQQAPSAHACANAPSLRRTAAAIPPSARQPSWSNDL